MSHHSSEAYLQSPASQKWVSTDPVNSMEHMYTTSEYESFDTERAHNMGWSVYPLCDVEHPPNLEQKMLSLCGYLYC